MTRWAWLGWGLAAILLFWGIGAYNRVMSLRNAIVAAFAVLDQHLTARALIFGQLLTLLRPMLPTEQATFDALEAAQAEVHAAALTRLMSLLEQHAGLREHAELYALVDELKLIERQRSFARQVFNQAVAQYNDAITQFPTRILASIYGFREARSL